MWVGWKDWAGDKDLTRNMDRVMGGALTIQQDTRTDPIFDEFMETVLTTSYSFHSVISGIMLNIIDSLVS